jgi:gliding motility-associated-like protein
LTYVFSPTGPAVGASGIISGMTVGTSYTVEASDGTCSSTPSSAFSVAAQLAAPSAPTLTAIPPSCTFDGASAVSNYNASFTYSFNPSGPTVGVGGAISNMTVGTSYTVTANDGTCPSLPSTSFSNAAATGVPAVPTISTTPPSCSADGNSTISNYVGSLTYIFNPTGPSVGAGGVISGMVNGTSYTVVASDGTCSSAPSTTFSNLAQLVTPTTPTITSTPPTCTADGSSAVSNYDATVSYFFTPTGPTVAAGGAISGMTVGTSYTVAADNGLCSSTPSNSFSNAAATGVPAVPTIVTTPASCSANGSSTISNYVGTLTYIFSPTGPTVGAGGVISGMTIGNSYTVEASDGTCSSAPSTSFSNGAQFPPVVATINGSSTYCTGGNTTLTAIGGVSYTWSDATFNVIGNSAAVTITQGTYGVLVTDANGCTAVATSTVTESTTLTPTISGNLSYCAGSNTTLTASGGTIYSWSNTDATASTTVTAGTYSVTVDNGTGCSGTASATVTETALPNVTISGVLSYCAGSTTTLTANGAANYVWNDPLNSLTNAISVTQGSYTLTGTDANGCSNTATVVVNEIASGTLPNFNFTSPLTICLDQTAPTLPSVSNNGIPGTWSPTSISNTASDTYTFIVAPSQCAANFTLDVTVQDLQLTVSNDTTVDALSPVQLGAAVTGSTSGNYVWQPAATNLSCTNCANPVSSPTANISYTVRYTDTNSGCFVDGDVAITVNPVKGVAYIPTAFSPNNDGMNDLFRVGGSNIKDIYLTVYNRWGEKVFEEKSALPAWDGTFKGVRQPLGAYVYYATVTFNDNTRSNYQGNVTLLQ